MKVLNRPMFRYGGPIKEGIMSGIREPRQGYKLAGKVDRTVGGAQMVFPAEITSMMPNDASKVFANVAQTYQPIDSNVNTTDRYITVERRQPRTNNIVTQEIENPDFIPKYKTVRGPRIGERKVEITEDMENITGKASGTEMPPMLDQSGKMGAGTIDKVIENKGKIEDTPQPNKKERVNTILESLGYDRAQKNALYDAMIKAGQRISRTGLGAENLVSDVIAETSQSYDKPEKLREAANLMDVQQQLKLEQIKKSKDTRSPLQKNAEYLLEAGVVDNSKDAVLAAQGKATEANDIFFEASQKLNASKALDQTALTLGARGKFGEGIVFKNKVPKKYKGKPIETFLESGAFRGDGLYTADGKIMLIQDGKIKSELIIRGSIEEGLFSFGGDD